MFVVIPVGPPAPAQNKVQDTGWGDHWSELAEVFTCQGKQFVVGFVVMVGGAIVVAVNRSFCG